MKRPYILIVAVLFTTLYSCSAYRNNPTPDDVYYSPGAPAVSQSSAQNNNSDYYSTANDNYIKMRVENPDKWSYFDDYNYDYYGGGFAPYSSYSPYSPYSPYGPSFGLSIGFGAGYYSPYPYYGGFGYYSPLSYYNSYYAWNNFYNPYYGGIIVVNGKNTTTPSYTRMSNFNPTAYQGNYYNSRPTTNFINTNGRTSTNSSGNSFNRSTNSRPSFNNSNYSPMRSSPSNFSSGGGGGGASRGGGFSRPGR